MYKEETFINSIIFSSICTGKEIYIKSWRKCLLLLLLLVCGDIESCPGPETMENVLQNKGIMIFHQNCRDLFRIITNSTSLFSGEKIPWYKFMNGHYGKNGGVAMYLSDNIN